MKIQQRLIAILTAAFILSGCFPMPAARADQQPEDTITTQDDTAAHDGNTTEETQPFESVAEPSPSESGEKTTEDEEDTDKASQSESAVETTEETDDTDKASQSESVAETTEKTDDTDDTEDTDMTPQPESETEIAEETEDETEYPVPDEPPEFHAYIERKPLGYIVKGTFTEFTPDITHIYPMYSLDGKNWQRVDDEYEWDLTLLEYLGTDNENGLHELQNQMLGLEDMREPLKSYVTGEIECIYVKMHIIRQNGRSYDSKSAVIEQTLLPIPDDTTYSARFYSTVVVREWNPNTRRNREYGRYQLTVSSDTKTEDISALLPDTLPIQVELQNPREIVPYASAVVDCPVTWKSLSLPPLSAGESITITDATEKIQIPAGTQIRTPLGIFQLDKPLSVDTDHSISCDYYNEVELVVNVSTATSNPTGVLREVGGLKISLHKKATGATSIKTYILIEGESEWTELTGLSLLKELSLQSSTANGGYALVLRSDQEPYRSYLEAQKAGKKSTPFFIGLEFEGGIYDGKQLILAWPDTYEVLPDLPNFNGISGNEDNAGANNNHDSTENGQRPNLPQTPDDEPKEQQPTLFQTPSEEQAGQQIDPGAPSDDNGLAQPVPVNPENQNIPSPEEVDNGISIQQLDPDSQKPEITESGQRPNLPQIAQDTVDTPYAEGSTTAAGQMDSLIVELFDSPAQTPVKVQAATERIDDNAEITIEHITESDNRIPLLPVTIVAAACICIGAAVYKTAGYGLFRQIAGKIRNILHQ